MTTEREGSLAELGRLVGHHFADLDLLERALVHPSRREEHDGQDNETLEFLGDAVLNLAIGERLMRENPQHDEGALSRLRASLVSAPSLAAVAEDLGLGAWLRLGRGEEKTGGRGKLSILAACYEAVIGAIFLDGGYERTQSAIARHFGTDLIERSARQVDHKSILQELTQARYKSTPEYRVVETSGPDHARQYQVEVLVAGEVLGLAEGSSRKTAEQGAACQAIGVLEERDDGGS